MYYLPQFFPSIATVISIIFSNIKVTMKEKPCTEERLFINDNKNSCLSFYW